MLHPSVVSSCCHGNGLQSDARHVTEKRENEGTPWVRSLLISLGGALVLVDVVAATPHEQ